MLRQTNANLDYCVLRNLAQLQSQEVLCIDAKARPAGDLRAADNFAFMGARKALFMISFSFIIYFIIQLFHSGRVIQRYHVIPLDIR